jgi:hypothetical protein
MSDEAKAAWFLDADFTPTSTLVERLRKPERVVVNEAGFTMLFSSSDKLDAADRIEKLEAVTKDDARWLAAYHKWCEMNGCAPSSSDLITARKALEGKDD